MQRYRFRTKTSVGSLKDAVRKRAGNCCEICGNKPPRNPGGKTRGTIHHRHPRRLGGKDTVENMILLCYACHRDIHREEWDAADLGWLCWVDSAFTPMLHHLVGWVLLVPDGSMEPLVEAEALRLLDYQNGCAIEA